ncbi:sodium/solute symporter [Lignipirellula cremea]|uniref:Cation/acetate symporter ActP n=1 Tax=Lignipirellula cremea TaxID=2528010 RepID=A0A518E1T7_9BACT|nr:cation acetate symporter [Lignipirellula cremea]QDU98032.1 Cation/acetate symporter ActP [Lignipirellula cremea]
MNHEQSFGAIAVFAAFVAFTLGLSFYLGGKAKSAKGYFAAEGEIPWFINGVAFAGDYLSAASFLGICGMIAFFGYDGFLYSIGYLAGWVVALFVVAEPMKRLGKFTFADALDSTFQSRGIKLVAGISTLAVSVFYLIPQMVGAGVLVEPLLGLPHYVGVIMVGAAVILIVVTAGMVSTTWVQFLKGGLLVVFSTVMVGMVLMRGFTATPIEDMPELAVLGPYSGGSYETELAAELEKHSLTVLPATGLWDTPDFVRLSAGPDAAPLVYSVSMSASGAITLFEAQTVEMVDGKKFVNGREQENVAGEDGVRHDLRPVGRILKLPDGETSTGPIGPLKFFSTLQQSTMMISSKKTLKFETDTIDVYFETPTLGSKLLLPGQYFTGIRTKLFSDKLNFLSLMLALFCGTASLPHILIRYYTVKDESSARKSTIVGIGTIGFFYVLSLYIGLGAMTSGALDVTNNNMAAPLLARSLAEWLFAVISAIAFTTVLGTVSGLILASAGAVAHDLLKEFGQMEFNDSEQVRVAKISSVVVGVVAIVLGIVFKEFNVTYLVGWAFSVAASANLPSLVMLLFWKGVTKQGVIAAVTVGMTTSLGWILLSADTFSKVYKIDPELAITPFSQPGLVTIPLGFLTLIVVSLLTKKRAE